MKIKYRGIIHPCKIYGVLSTGRPFLLIGPQKSHVGDIIAEHKIGYQVNHGDVGNILSVINEVRHLSDDAVSAIRDKSINLVNTRYSRKNLTRKFINVCIR